MDRRNEVAASSGKYGKLLISYGYACQHGRASASRTPRTAPRELNFGLWLGPATKQPYHENIVHYNWHWFWDFGNGEIGNQGVHQVDVAHWGSRGAAPTTRSASAAGSATKIRARRPIPS